MAGNYKIEMMEQRAAVAIEAHLDFKDRLLSAYANRRQQRRQSGIPVLAILGNGRAGKDTAGEYIEKVTGLKYSGSSSRNLGVFVAHMVGLTLDEANAERHDHRDFWIAAGHAVRGKDLAMLAKFALAEGDLAVGLRGRQELYGCMRDGVVDYAAWIDNPRVLPDKTVEFTMADCDFAVPNHGSFSEFYRKLDKLIKLLRLKPQE